MKELIERLEKATGPDRDLDARIYCALNGHTFRSIGRTGCIHFEPDATGTHTMVTPPHPYTASIDAALTLVDFNAGWLPYIELDSRSHRWEVQLGHMAYDATGVVFHKSLPIAICIVALAARASLTADN